MESRRLPRISAEESINFSFAITQYLLKVVAWCIAWMLHLTVAIVVATGMWLTNFSANDAFAWAHQIATSSLPAAVAGLGVTGLVAVAAYWRSVRWLAGRIGSRMLSAGIEQHNEVMARE